MAFFKKKEDKEKEENKDMSTLDQVRKAYEDLSEDDKKSFRQSIADRVHESVAAQERTEGDEDKQSADAREHEALGAEHAAGEGDVSELRERDDTAEEKREDAKDESRRFEDMIAPIRDEIEKLRRELTEYKREPRRADDADSEKLRHLENKYTN